MAIRSLLTQAMKRGIGSLRPKPKVNRRLTPEEIAERGDKATEFVPPYMPGASSQVMRAKQVGDETMDMIRASVMKMDLPPAKKIEAIKSAATTLRNANSAQLAKADPTKLAKDILKIGLGATVGLGAGMGLEGAAREGRLPEMIQDSILVDPEFRGKRPGAAVGEMLKSTKMDGGDYTYPFEGGVGNLLRDITPGATLFERNSQISDDTTWPGPGSDDPTDNMRMFGFDYTEPDPEPGLEEGSIADLLLFNRLFGD
tara:strand:- start:44 stop:814 length:771 start_codon:yes stop_codon:yes gene_type:complete